MPPKLDRAQVVDTALRLLDETGLDGLTLRRIATELDVKAPALYWHFANKQALLDEMATEMLRRTYAGPVAVPDSWQQAITGTCRTLRAALLGYRDGAKVFSGTRLTDYGHAEGQHAMLAAFTRAGFELADAVQAFTTAYAYTVGFVIEEQAVHPVPGERAPGYDPEQRAAGIAPEYALAAEAGRDLFGDFERRFERGLAIIVAGVEATLSPPSTRPTP
ncbi:TetR/AcrR family transcriptional regulator C-terminal domain-containing protein [Kitasatospora sp. NPDC093806]|uniref:TetR/AcrR family transcriptional regulator C-terminal domain-containing protein n=1 Tax=Kitasatospora sp. NPDC093806 TaxID=3155075 RepID=UPI003429A1C8